MEGRRGEEAGVQEVQEELCRVTNTAFVQVLSVRESCSSSTTPLPSSPMVVGVLGCSSPIVVGVRVQVAECSPTSVAGEERASPR